MSQAQPQPEGRRLRILIVEDNPDDATMMAHELAGAGLAFTHEVVDDEPAFTAALDGGADLILCDHTLPHFSARRAFEILQQRAVHVPVVIVSGTITDEYAVEFMRRGAVDYVLKDRIGRLGPAAKNALDRFRLEQEAVEAGRRLTQLLLDLKVAAMTSDSDGRILVCNDVIWQMLGYRSADAFRAVPTTRHHANPSRREDLIAHLSRGEQVTGYDVEYLRADGTSIWTTGEYRGIRDGQGTLVRIESLFTDSTQQKRIESELEEHTALLNEVITRAPLGIARIAGDLRVMDANPMLGEMLRVPLPRLTNSSLTDFLDEEGAAQARERFQQLREGSTRSMEADGAMRRADGTTIWVHRTVSAVTGSDGRVRYFLEMFDDTTAKHEIEEMVKANLAASERLNALKSEFMSMVSHEFRTALTGIQGYSEILASEQVSPEEVKQFAGDINADALRLNRMITEMLDLDRIESGRMRMKLTPLDLNDLLQQAADRAEMSTDIHRILLSLDPELPLVEGDSDRLIQVVTNLLSNAIKYSPAGGEVVVTSRMKDGMACVAVRDHGTGIAPEFQDRIFGRYERYEGAGKQGVVGTGLGLAIAKQIIQLHGGRIWVESALGAGSTFKFTLPLTRPVPQGAPPVARPAEQVPSQRPAGTRR